MASGQGLYAAYTEAEKDRLIYERGERERAEKRDRRERRTLLWINLLFTYTAMLAAGYAVAIYAKSADAGCAAFLALLAVHCSIDYHAVRTTK